MTCPPEQQTRPPPTQPYEVLLGSGGMGMRQIAINAITLTGAGQIRRIKTAFYRLLACTTLCIWNSDLTAISNNESPNAVMEKYSQF